eukprot:jgi/Mesen1/9051/ME000057S08469
MEANLNLDRSRLQVIVVKKITLEFPPDLLDKIGEKPSGESLIEQNMRRRKARRAAAAPSSDGQKEGTEDSSSSGQSSKTGETLHSSSEGAPQTGAGGNSPVLKVRLEELQQLEDELITRAGSNGKKADADVLKNLETVRGNFRAFYSDSETGTSEPPSGSTQSGDRVDSLKALLDAGKTASSKEAENRAALATKVAMTVKLLREILPFSIAEFFYSPSGESMRGGGADVEFQLIHNIYFRNQNGGPLATVDRAALQRLAFADTSFSPVQPVACQQGLLFFGSLEGDPSTTWQKIQANLDEHFPKLVAILGRDDVVREAVGCLIAPRSELLSFSLPRPLFAAATVASLSAIAWLTQQAIHASGAGGDHQLTESASAAAAAAASMPAYVPLDPTYVPLDLAHVLGPASWQLSIAPLGLLAVMGTYVAAQVLAASRHGAAKALDYPILLPAPLVGSLGLVVGLKGHLPTRRALLDLAVSGPLAAAAASCTLLLCGSGPLLLDWLSGSGSGSSGGVTSGGVSLEDLVMVPASLFSYSGVFSDLASHLAAAVFVGEGEGSAAELAMLPTALAGLLGLHLTALSLLPIGILNGGRIVTGVFGRKAQHWTSVAAVGAVGLSMALHDTWQGALWLGYMLAFAKKDDWFQWDEVSEPGPLRTLLGLALVSGAVVCCLPPL